MATYDRAAITAFAEVFETARQQLEDLRDDELRPEISEADFGDAWHDKGAKFVQQMEKIELDLGNLADVMEHLNLSLIDAANRMQATESEQAGRLSQFASRVADAGAEAGA